MSPRRRPLRGSPLLVSAAGAVLTIACGGGGGRPYPPGNLMAPPTVQVCVTATPPEAPVTINGYPPDDQGCSSVNQGSTVVIESQLEGYQPYREEYPVGDGGPHPIELVPATAEEAPPLESP